MALKEPPLTVTVAEVSHDFAADPAGAEAKYLGKKLLFSNV